MELNKLPAYLYKASEKLSCNKIMNCTLPNDFNGKIFVDAAYKLGKYQYVIYNMGKIGIMEIEENQLVISDGFNGCWMAKFKLHDKTYACHIAMDDTAKLLEYFLDFVKKHKADILALFKPVALATLSYKQVCNSCIGVITGDNRKVYINVEKETLAAFMPREILSDNMPIMRQDGKWKEDEYGEIALSNDLLNIME